MDKAKAIGWALFLMLVLPPAEAAAQAAQISYCHNYGCSARGVVRFSASEMADLKRILAAGRSSPAAERAAISRADQWYERKAGAQTGTSGDRAKDDFTLFRPLGQIDCVDEAINTTTLLKLVEARGWLVHHRAGPMANRGFLIDGRYPHNTATIVEKATGRRWAVDSWVRANAEPPDIKPLEIWSEEGGRGS